MCCETTTHHSQTHGHSGSCGCACSGPLIWSKKKQIRILEHSLKCLRERTRDIEERLEELQAEK
jgi:hypothetical protein